MRAFTDRWVEMIREQISFRIMMEVDYNDIDNVDIMMTAYLNMANQIIRSLSKKVLYCTMTNVFTHLLSDRVIIKLLEFTNEQLIKLGYFPTNVHGFKELLGIRWL